MWVHFFLFTPKVSAANQVVTNLNNAGAGSLRQAIADVGDSEAITFQSELTGEISLSSVGGDGGEIDIAGKSITIEGPGVDDLTITYNGDGDGLMRLFNIDATGGLTISDLTITGFSTSYENGGTFLNAGTLTIEDCIISSNSAISGHGGAISSDGTLTITGTTFSSINATEGEGESGLGGAIFSSDETATITNCIFTNNESAIAGGALAALSENIVVEISGSTFTENTSIAGTAIAIEGGELVVSDSTFFSNNTAEAGMFSGTIVSMASTVEISENTKIINNNSTISDVGGIALFSCESTITDTIIAGNSSKKIGGIDQQGGTLTMNRVSVTENSATTEGGYAGGISIREDSSATIINSTIGGNTSESVVGGIFTSDNSNVDLIHTTVYDNSPLGAGSCMVEGEEDEPWFGTPCDESCSFDVYNSIIYDVPHTENWSFSGGITFGGANIRGGSYNSFSEYVDSQEENVINGRPLLYAVRDENDILTHYNFQTSESPAIDAGRDLEEMSQIAD